MKLHAIVYIWLAYMMIHNATASDGSGIVLGIPSGKLYQRSYGIESKLTLVQEPFILTPSLPSECILETASLHHASRLHLLDDRWELNYRLQLFSTKTNHLLHHKSVRTCRSLGIHLFQF